MLRFIRSFSIVVLAALLVACVAPPAASPTTPIPSTAIPPTSAPVASTTAGEVKLTIVYDNSTTDPQLKPEQGFSAVVETDGHMLLFDTGTNGSVLLDNMRQLGIDPQSIEAVILSHDHIDHTGGLQALLDLGIRPTVYVPSKLLEYFKAKVRAQTELIEVENALEILPGVHTTRPIGSVIEQALVLETRDGAVVITGCAHPGVVNMVHQAQEVAGAKIALLAGGFHLRDVSDSELPLIVARNTPGGCREIMPCHCTGREGHRLVQHRVW